MVPKGDVMEWLLLSVLSTLSFSAYTILQKLTFQRYLGNVFAYAFLGAVLHLSIAVVILLLDPVRIPWTSGPFLTILTAGLIHGCFTLMMFTVVQREPEVTRVMPVIDTYPIFVAVMAVLFLGEAFTVPTFLAVGLVVGGALVASWHRGLPGERIKQARTLLIMIGVSFCIGVYTILSKYALSGLDIWQAYALSSIASAPVFALAVHHFRAWPDVRRALAQPKVVAIAASGHFMLFLAFIVGLLAFTMGPVTLSSAVMASRPLVVLGYVAVINVAFPNLMTERLMGSGFLRKGLAAAMVTAGVGAMAFV
ncbi:MAG: Permease of the drug/metabolite transporter (DMT) superfamily [Chloroflexi bacterium]|nr:MAG: Permease of the drug/metabolite transporter (DMT) superfamily [Chloroflexota bacterium]